MIKATTKSRWEIAQETEKGFWVGKYPKDLIFTLEKKYSTKAKFIIRECNKIKKINKNTKILQVGSAVLDAINYIKLGKKYSLDPLADFYKKNFKVDYSKIKFEKGIAEKLPYKNNFFDIIIFTNVLDHVINPEKVLSEIYRVLKKDGLLYFEVDFSDKSFIAIYKFWKFLNNLFGKTFNKPHPHIFSLTDVQKLLNEKFKLIKKFEIVYRNQNPLVNLLANIGFSSNMYYRAIYKKSEEKQ